MCLRPILIKNVNYGTKNNFTSSVTDTVSPFIPVPCGRCSVCLQLKQQYLVQRVQMESLDHDLFFGTLTYNNEMLPTVSYGEFNLAYANKDDWQRMIKHIRKYENLPPFKYLVVSEYGGRKHRPHFHFILSFKKVPGSTLADKWSLQQNLYDIFLRYWRRNVNLTDKYTKTGKQRVNTRRPIWKNLCTFYVSRGRYNFDLHYLDPWLSPNGVDDVSFYVSKYVLKYDKWVDMLKSKLYFNLCESEFKKCWNTIKPFRSLSKGFGDSSGIDVMKHIDKGIRLALADKNALFPYFISPVNGNTFPLAPYYAKKFVKAADQMVFVSRRPRLDGMFTDESLLTVEDKLTKQKKFDIVRDSLNNTHTYEDDDMNLINNLHISQIYGQLKETPFLDSDFATSWQDF